MRTMFVPKNALVVWLALLWMSALEGGFSEGRDGQVLPSVIHTNVNDATYVKLLPIVCRATRFPDLCISSLYADPRSLTANSTELVRIGIDLGWIHARRSFALLQNLLHSGEIDVNTTSAALVCLESLKYGSTTVARSRDSLLFNPIQDIQAWLSASVQFQYDCFSAATNVLNAPEFVIEVMIPQVNFTMQLLSNALCMTDALAAHGSDPFTWEPPPETRPANLSSILTESSPDWTDKNLDGQSWRLSDLAPNVTVSQDGSSNFSSVQEAVDNAPTYSKDRYIIHIKEGIYSETVRVHQNKTRMTFVGDGVNRTILTGHKNASSPGLSTFQTASVVVVGDGFMAIGITFQNTAGPNSRQAVAIRVDSDLSAFQECWFDGYQDTLYVHTGRQFYKNCSIWGTVDFIFGNSAAVFQDCRLVVRNSHLGVTSSFVTAQGRTDPGQTTGLVFQNCTVTSSPDYVQVAHKAYLGRPWKLYSRTIFVNTYIDSLIDPTGWFQWNGDALDSLLYGEYGSYGPGAANLSAREPWSNQLTDGQARHFSVDNFIQGRWWLPTMGVVSNNFFTVKSEPEE